MLPIRLCYTIYMKLGELVRQLYISERKLVDYALNPNNDQGKHKAVVFEQKLGFTASNCAALRQQIYETALEAEVSIGQLDLYGTRVRTDLTILGVQGQVAVVRVGWLIPPESSEAHLTTLFVRKT